MEASRDMNGRTDTTSEVAVARLGDLKEGRSKAFEAGGFALLLILVEGEVFAVRNRCTHARSVLGPGRLTKDCLLECPMHGALFSPEDGSVQKGPAVKPLVTFPVRIVDGTVLVELPK